MIVEYILFAAFLFASAKMDANLLNRGSFIYEHYTRVMLRLISIYLLCDNNWELFLGFSLIFAGSFDNILNLMRRREFFHLGTTAKWDKFWRKKPNLYKLFVLLSIPSGIYLLIKNY